MSAESILTRGRARAESRMTSTCTIRRRAGTTAGAGGFQVPGWDVRMTARPCRIAGAAATDRRWRTVKVGDVEVQVASRVLHLPAGTTGLRDNDYVEITSGEVAGHAFRIVESTIADQQTAVRVQVFEVDRPAEWA